MINQEAIIKRDKHIFGALYGLIAGAAFAIALWGMDAVLLSQNHAFFPWLKVIAGIVLCGSIGAIVGWIAMRFEGGIQGFLLWLAGAGLMTWVAIGLPLRIIPVLAPMLEPDLAHYLDYGAGSGYEARFLVAVVWITIFVALTGVLQMAMVDTAVFANSAFGRIAPFVVCIVLMAIGGTVMDDLINDPFRKAIMSVETPINFILDHRGLDIDPAESRRAHAGSLRGVQDEITENRRLIVRSYDENFGQIRVLVRFANVWVDCVTVNGQSSFCELAEPNSGQ
jgi:hypothetical protein